jgi:hypothetical protein
MSIPVTKTEHFVASAIWARREPDSPTAEDRGSDWDGELLTLSGSWCERSRPKRTAHVSRAVLGCKRFVGASRERLLSRPFRHGS